MMRFFGSICFIKSPKFCEDKAATEFGKKVMDDLAECLGGQANYRGGKI